MRCPVCKGSGWEDERDDYCAYCDGLGDLCDECRKSFPDCFCEDEEDDQ